MARSLLAGSLAILTLIVSVPARAEIISTSEALAAEERTEALEVVEAYLAREDVAAQLAALGVEPELARLRAEVLSQDELEDLAGRIEEEPAGGDGLLVVLGVTFVVLLVLELVGVIDIFKKV